jgi:hypothetical protein
MTISRNQGKKEIWIREQGKQEGISQRSNEEGFEARFPLAQARGLESHLGLGKARDILTCQRLA